MVAIDLSEPTDIADKLLWRDARRILARHSDTDGFGRCSWCGESWPCSPRTLAQRAESAAWCVPDEVFAPESSGGWHRTGVNRGAF